MTRDLIAGMLGVTANTSLSRTRGHGLADFAQLRLQPQFIFEADAHEDFLACR